MCRSGSLVGVVAALVVACGGGDPTPLDREAGIDGAMTGGDSAVGDDGSTTDDSSAELDAESPVDSGTANDSGIARSSDAGDGGQCSAPGQCDSAHPCPMIGGQRGTCCAPIVIERGGCGSCSGGVCPG